ncbi:polysaccharide deacetylase family protein [Actinomadura rudentiformis]|uniref:Polysaccharide deacetylase family protein n=2 Tax=Actinomadura rudentiformis TaxID=359158 RepID=A0A6H9Z603_9ACTN|nr:polysaccharide deacetylase family protein [Actinomadura rudentiformis]
MYHSVNNRAHDPHLITVSPGRFERQMSWLRSKGLRGVSMIELLHAQQAGQARRLVGLTFDDGYADFFGHAVPILARYGFTATVFMVSARIGEASAWDGGPRKPLMNEAQLRAVVRCGMEVGSHGAQHLSLPSLEDDQLEQELKQSRATLEEMLDRRVPGFAYPHGHVTRRVITAVREAGYEYGCAIWGEHPGPHAIPRTCIGEKDRQLRLQAKVARHHLRWNMRR